MTFDAHLTRARIAGVTVCAIGTAGTWLLGRHAVGSFGHAGDADDAVATAFLLALSVAIGWLTLLTAAATASLDDVGVHTREGDLEHRLVRRMATTLLLVAGGTAASSIQPAQAQLRSAASVSAQVRALADGPNAGSPAPSSSTSTSSSTSSGSSTSSDSSGSSTRSGSLTNAPDPSFGDVGRVNTTPHKKASDVTTATPDPWLPTHPRSATPSDGSLLAGTPHNASANADIVVRQGDSLWTIVRRHLGEGADPMVVAREIPRWHATNRQAIGANPNLLHPGQILHAPGAGS